MSAFKILNLNAKYTFFCHFLFLDVLCVPRSFSIICYDDAENTSYFQEIYNRYNDHN